MAESNRDIADQFENRFLELNSRRILTEGEHRWLRPDEICEVLRNLNGVPISKEPAAMPPSGSIFLFDKKVQKHFRNDGYKWKKAKDGRAKEGHEKLKVEGLDTLNCYYAHGEEDQSFQRRIYWMLEENLSHMVLVHYRDVKGEKRKARYIKETESAEGIQHSRETDEIPPNSEMDSFASSSFNSTYNHQASSELPPLPKSQRYVSRPMIRKNCKEREVEEAVSSCFSPTNLQMHSQAIDPGSLSGVYASDCEETQSGAYTVADDIDWKSLYNNVTTGLYETEYTTRLEMDNFDSTRFADSTSCYNANSSNFGDDETGCNYFSFSVAVEPSHASLGKRQREEGKSKATPLATTEEVDEEKDEEEEGNDINQVQKRLKVTYGQKVQEFNSAIQQGEVIAGNNPAESDVAVTIDTAITDGATNDATALSQSNIQDSQSIIEAQQDDEITSLAAFRIADPSGAATSAIGPIHLNPYTIANVADQNATQISSLPTVIVSNRGLNNQQAAQLQPSVPQPTASVGSAISATTNKTAAPESSNPALVQSRPTSDTNQDFVQDVENQEKETGPTSFVPENGKGKIVVQRDVGTEKFQIQDSPSIIQAQEGDATAILAAFSITDPSGAASLVRGPIHLNPATIANVVDQAQDSQPTVTTRIVISATTNETAASESSNHALVQWEPTSNANQDFTQDVVESQEKGTEPTSIEPENGKSKAVVQRDFGTVTGKSHEFSEVVMSSHKRLHQLLDRASAPNTLPSSSSSTPTIDSQAIATTRATLEMDFITMASEVQRTRMISSIQSLVDSNCFPIGTRPMILAMLKQLEQSILAYSEAYSEYDMGKNLTDQVEASKQLLQPRVQLCDSKEKEFQKLEEKKMKIEARQAAILAEIHGAVKETEPIQAHLEKLLLQQDQFKENENNLKNILDIGRGIWTILKSIIHRNLPM